MFGKMYKMKLPKEIIIFTGFIAGFTIAGFIQLIIGTLFGLHSNQIIINSTGVIFILNSIIGGIITANLVDEKNLNQASVK